VRVVWPATFRRYGRSLTPLRPAAPGSSSPFSAALSLRRA
jgi:hypothetical protein